MVVSATLHLSAALLRKVQRLDKPQAASLGRLILYSQTELDRFKIRRNFVSYPRYWPFVFIETGALLIRAIDFSFQNFSNRSKKNNQLDTLFYTQ